MTPDTLAAIVERPVDELERLATAAQEPEEGEWYAADALRCLGDELERAYIAAVSPDVVLGLLADRRALLALLRDTRQALANLLSYPGPVRMTEASHETCSPDECYVTAARAAIAALDPEPPA